MQKLSFFEAYKSIRNRLRRYTTTSIITLAIQQLHQNTSSNIERLKFAPWVTLLVVKWSLQDNLADKQASKVITEVELNKIKNEVWHISGKLNERDPNTLPSHLFMRRLLYTQAELQKPETAGIIREACLLNSLSESHVLRRELLKKTGLHPEHFIDLSFAIFSQINAGYKVIEPNFFQPFSKIYSKSIIQAFITCVSCNHKQLQTFLRQLPDAKKKYNQNYMNFQYFQDIHCIEKMAH